MPAGVVSVRLGLRLEICCVGAVNSCHGDWVVPIQG